MSFWGKHQEVLGWGNAYMDSTILNLWIEESFEDVQCSIKFWALKTKIYHSNWKKIDVKLLNPPPPDYSEVINFDLTIKKLTNYFKMKKLSFVCIDESEDDECNFSFFN